MENIVYKTLDCEVKKLNELTFEFTASNEEIDRDGEIIEAKGWDLKNFKKNPVITWAHQYGELPIGKAPKVWVSEGKLKNLVEFPAEGVYEFADIVRRLVDGGFLKAESVGFKPYPDSIVEVEGGDGIKTPRRRLTKNELLEIAIVPVPSNPNALLEAKTKGIITDKELELITKPEETENYFRVPVAGEGGDKHSGHRIRTIDISKEKGIKALYCGECKVVITYLFSTEDKFGWTMARAEAWVKEHAKSLDISITTNSETKEEIILVTTRTDDVVLNSPRVIQAKPKVISQAEIKDELDYLLASIKAQGLNQESQGSAWILVNEIMRLHGSDIPLDIQAKIGAVLNKKNKERLQQIQQIAQDILDSAEHEEEPKSEPKAAILDKKEIAIAVAQVIAKMRGKII